MGDPSRSLGNYVVLQRGTTYQSRLLGRPGPVLLGLSSIMRNGGFRTDALRTYGGESPGKLLLRPGDLYVSLKDVTQAGDLLGAIARVPAGVPLGRLTQDTVKLDIVNGLPPAYLYWLLRTEQYREYCRAHAIGTTNLSLSRDDFLAFPVPVPTVDRLALVRLLDSLEDKVVANEQTASLSSAMSSSVYERSIEFGSPRRCVDEVAAFHNSKRSPLSSRERKALVGPYPYYGANGVIDHLAEYRFDGDYVLVGEDGTVVTDAGAPVVRHVRGKFWVSNHAHVLDGVDISNELLTLALIHADVKPYITGAVQPKLSMGNLRKLTVRLPAPNRQSIVEKKIRSLSLLVEAKNRENLVLAELRNTLLPKLMSGEIRVWEAEKVVGEVL